MNLEEQNKLRLSIQNALLELRRVCTPLEVHLSVVWRRTFETRPARVEVQVFLPRIRRGWADGSGNGPGELP